MYVYSHSTLTCSVRLTGLPTPLLAVQRKVPVSVLLMLFKSQVVPLCNTSLSLPLGKILAQVISGAGRPDAIQNSCRSEPSSKCLSLLTLVMVAGAKRYDDISQRMNNVIQYKSACLQQCIK